MQANKNSTGRQLHPRNLLSMNILKAPRNTYNFNCYRTYPLLFERTYKTWIGIAHH